jgi:hypothetical protein
MGMIAKAVLPTANYANLAKLKAIELKNRKAAKEATKVRFRHWAENFRILRAIMDLLPASGDTDGEARGALLEKAIAAHAGLSGKAVERARGHWQYRRVLWVNRCGSGIWEFRFQRKVVEGIWQTWVTAPRDVFALVKAHQAQREAIAPLKCNRDSAGAA